MGKKSKNKGANFERKIAKFLDSWWNKKGLEGNFYKTAASGALKWHQRPDVIGDICTPKNFTQTIECKNREDWEHKQFIEICQPCKSGLYSWWDQACDEASRANKNPWLIIKKNYCKELLIFSVIDNLSWNAINSIKKKVILTHIPTFVEYGWNKVCVVPLELFLEVANPKMFLFDEKEE